MILKSKQFFVCFCISCIFFCIFYLFIFFVFNFILHFLDKYKYSDLQISIIITQLSLIRSATHSSQTKYSIQFKYIRLKNSLRICDLFLQMLKLLLLITIIIILLFYYINKVIIYQLRNKNCLYLQ